MCPAVRRCSSFINWDPLSYSLSGMISYLLLLYLTTGQLYKKRVSLSVVCHIFIALFVPYQKIIRTIPKPTNIPFKHFQEKAIYFSALQNIIYKLQLLAIHLEYLITYTNLTKTTFLQNSLGCDIIICCFSFYLFYI